MTQQTITNLTILTKDLKPGHLVKKPNNEIEYVILSIEKSLPGERDFKIELCAPNSQFHKAPFCLYAWANDEWIKPIETKLYNYLEEYNKTHPPLKQLTLAENDARIESYRQRDWWGNPLTSEDKAEHLWNLYQREELSNYKHFYLKMFAQRKGFKLPEYDRDTYGFPVFTEEQIKQLEALHND